MTEFSPKSHRLKLTLMINIIVLAAGSNDEFANEGYRFPKNLIEIHGTPLIARVISSTSKIADEARLVVCIRHDEDTEFHTSEILRLVSPRTEVIRVHRSTAGALCTSLLAVDYIADNDELLILNGDSMILRDLDQILGEFRKRRLDAGTVCFKSVHPRFSFVRVTEDLRVLEVAEKRPISQFATAGVYWFRNGGEYKELAFRSIARRQDVDGKFYVSPVLNEFILERRIVGAIEIDVDDYANLQSPKLINDFIRKIDNQGADGT